MSYGQYSSGRINPTEQIRRTGIKGRGRVRRVFDYAMCAHVWAQQTQEDGRSTKGQMYFRDAVIYSYGTHYPIAAFHVAADATRAVLFNSEKNSQTTEGHKHHVRNALSGLGVPVFVVPRVVSAFGHEMKPRDHEINVAYYVDRFNAQSSRMAKPHVRVWHGYADNGEHIGDTCENRLRLVGADELASYCATFGLDMPELDIEGTRQKVRDAFARYNDPKRVAKRAAAQGKKAARHWLNVCTVAAFMEGVTDKLPLASFMPNSVKDAMASGLGFSSFWQLQNRVTEIKRERATRRDVKLISGEQWQAGQGNASQIRAHAHTLVRRRGDRLETSRGAECPFAHAVLAFVKAQECRATGTTWHRNGQQIRVGHFNVDSIDAQGNLRAGCHTLEYSEMLRLAVREVPHLVRACFGVPVALSV